MPPIKKIIIFFLMILLKFIDSYPQNLNTIDYKVDLISMTGNSKRYEIIFDNGVKLYIKIIEFNPTEHIISYKNDKVYEYGVIKIDNELFFGTDGGIPHNKLESLIIEINSEEINLDISYMFDPWVGDFPLSKNFRLKKFGDTYILTGKFSDGAGTYVAQWKILDGNQVRTIISDDEDIIVFSFFEVR